MHLAESVIGSEASVGGNHLKTKYSGQEHRRLSLAAKELNWSQKQFNDYVNARPNKFRLENMSENRSHRNEMPGKGDILDIKQDMRNFMNGGK